MTVRDLLLQFFLFTKNMLNSVLLFFFFLNIVNSTKEYVWVYVQ